MNPKSSDKQFKSLLKQAEYHKEKGEIQIAGKDWILIRSATFRDLFHGTAKMLGSGATVVWTEAGRHAGKEFAKTLLRERVEPEEVPRLLETFFTQGGWGKIQAQVDFAKKEVVVKIKNCATTRQTKANEPVCHFIKGYTAGVCAVMFDANMECVETECMAKGDAFCEFHVKRKMIG